MGRRGRARTGRNLIVAGFVCALSGWAAGCLPTRPGPHLQHFDAVAPALESDAPRFALRDLDGRPVELADWIGQRPIVLQLGSYSCPVFRQRRHWMNRMVAGYGEAVQFLVVYTTEAHPLDAPSPLTGAVWDPWVNRAAGVRVAKARSWAERREAAQLAREALDLRIPVLVDAMDDRVWRVYGRASSPAFVIDRAGRIALRQVWVDPGEIHATLQRLLTDSAPPRVSDARELAEDRDRGLR